MSLDTQVHRALSNPVRERLVSVLRATPEPWDVQSLADELDLHVNTVRTHLRVLVEAGLLTSRTENRDRPGRPRHVYEATDAAADATGGASYRFLSQVLVGYLSATDDDPAGAARQAGAAWGRHLIDQSAPFQRIPVGEAIDRLVGLLDEYGFAPELDEDGPDHPRVLLRRCPFLDVARDHQEVVCNIHLGLMRGALDGLGVEVDATGLRPFVEPSLCVAELEPTG